MPRLRARSFVTPDEVRELRGIRVESVVLGDMAVSHCRFESGWRWSVDMGPLLGEHSCPVRHVGYCVSGTMHVVLDDGQAIDIAPHAAFEIPPGHDKWVVGDEPWVAIEWGGTQRAFEAAMGEGSSGSLATVVFTDIVGSTARGHKVGDAAWSALLAAHNVRMREVLNLYRGREVATTGDGLLAVFDSPARAVRCAAEMVRAAAGIDLQIRVGVHTGEVEYVADDVRGIAVNTAARVMAIAQPDQVLLSSTTAALLDGSGLLLEDAGSHVMKGLPGPRQLFRLSRS